MSSHDESYRKSFGARLSAARKRTGMNQAQLADFAGIGRATLSRYERGDLTPPTDVLAELAMVLKPYDVSLEWLLYGTLAEEEEPHPFLLRRFGSLVALRFTSGGSAEVLMGMPEVVRFLRGCKTLVERSENPSQEVVDSAGVLIRHFCEREEQASFLADVPIAAHGVRLEPSIPDWDTAEDLARWTVFNGIEELEANEPEKGNREPAGVRQDISGEGHQIAGGNIENNGGVSIGRRSKE